MENVSLIKEGRYRLCHVLISGLLRAVQYRFAVLVPSTRRTPAVFGSLREY